MTWTPATGRSTSSRATGSLTTGAIRAYDLIRMISRDGRPTGLGEAFAHYGRIFKKLHILQILHDETYRRMIVSQKVTIQVVVAERGRR